jgi:poly(3-hydroxybutyrate) depolymerase
MACEHPELLTGIVSLAGSDWYDTADCAAPAPLAVLQVHGDWDATIRYDGMEMNVGNPDAPPVDVPGCLAAQCTDVFDGCTANENCNSLWECFLTCPEAADSDACIGACWNASPKPTQDQWTEVYVCAINAGCYDDLTYTWAGYPGAEDVVARWAARNGCSEATSAGTALDLVVDLAGIDTYPQEHNDCPDGLQATLWRIDKGSHVPAFGGNWSISVIEWMLNQVKPAP